MEILILICLLIIIALLLKDTIVIKKKDQPREKLKQTSNPNLPDIMGYSKSVNSHSLPKNANEGQIQESETNPDNLDIEYDENESLGIQISKEEPEKVFSSAPNLEEEEEEWNSYGISGGNDGFAQGVTFEELSSVGMLLQKHKLEPSQKETAVAIVQKIQGTELFSLLENSMESASRKIAELLDGSLSSESEFGSSILSKNDLEDFEINDFL